MFARLDFLKWKSCFRINFLYYMEKGSAWKYVKQPVLNFVWDLNFWDQRKVTFKKSFFKQGRRSTNWTEWISSPERTSKRVFSLELKSIFKTNLSLSMPIFLILNRSKFFAEQIYITKVSNLWCEICRYHSEFNDGEIASNLFSWKSTSLLSFSWRLYHGGFILNY